MTITRRTTSKIPTSVQIHIIPGIMIYLSLCQSKPAGVEIPVAHALPDSVSGRLTDRSEKQPPALKIHCDGVEPGQQSVAQQARFALEDGPLMHAGRDPLEAV